MQGMRVKMLLQKLRRNQIVPFRKSCGKSLFKILDGSVDLNEPSLQNAKMMSQGVAAALNSVMTFAFGGGGSKGIHRHTVINKKLLVRHRLKLLFDEDSQFLEVGILAGMAMDYGNIPAAGIVAGIGKIHGHYCLVGANDATVKGGTFFPITLVKQIRLQHLAFLNNVPCIYLVDSGGAFLPLQSDIFPDKNHGGRTFYNEAVFSAKGIPQIAVVCGSSTAGGAYCPTMAEEAIIVKKSGVIFLGGPPLVKAATGEIVTEQELGGAELHCSVSGCTDYFAETEEEAFEMCRESILTLNLPSILPEREVEQPLYSCEELEILSGKDVLSKEDIYKILARVLDGSMFKEFKQKFGINLITGFGYLNGNLIGIIANCGFITYKDAQKGCHFINLCDKRKIPLLFLQNSVNTEWQDESVDGITLKERAKMVSSHSSSKVPKIVLNIGSCIGDDNFTMCGWFFEPNFFFSWPLAHTSLLNMDLKKVKDGENNILHSFNSKKDASYLSLFDVPSSAFSKASNMMQDGIIFPKETRKVLSLCVDIVKHGKQNMLSAEVNQLSVMRM